MEPINNIHDKMFKKTFETPENVRIFLKMALPSELVSLIDLTDIQTDPGNYITDEFKEFVSDMVIHTRIKTVETDETSENGEPFLPTDIYFLLEHKSYGDSKIFVQILNYMCKEWLKDCRENKPLRVILPVVFYHGAETWTIPQTFTDQFNVSTELKKFMLNYRYILYDTNAIDFFALKNEEFKSNVYLFTSFVLMKCAYHNDTETVREIFRFWVKNGFINENDSLFFFLTYINRTQKIEKKKLIKIFEESHIYGGELMLTVAEQWLEEGKQAGIKEGIEKGKQIGIEEGIEKGIEKGIDQGVIKVALEMIRKNTDLRFIQDVTGLDMEKIEDLALNGK